MGPASQIAVRRRGSVVARSPFHPVRTQTPGYRRHENGPYAENDSGVRAVRFDTISPLLPGFAPYVTSLRERLKNAQVEGFLVVYRVKDLLDALPDPWRLRVTVGARRS